MQLADKGALVTIDDRIFPSTEIAGVIAIASDRSNSIHRIWRLVENAGEFVSLRNQGDILNILRDGAEGMDGIIDASSHMDITNYGDIWGLLRSSPTLRRAIYYINRYSILLNLRYHIDLRISDRLANTNFVRRHKFEDGYHDTFLAIDMIKLTQIFRGIIGRRITPVDVEFDIPLGRSKPRFEEIFGCEVRSGPGRIRFDRDLLDLPLPGADAKQHSQYSERCDRAMRELLKPLDVAEMVRRVLLARASQIPTLAQIARQLCLSTRTFRRRLSDAGTSYKDLVREARFNMAAHYLATTDLRTEVVAELLGYSDPANFRHAFKRWSGMSPRRFSVAGRAANTAGLCRVPSAAICAQMSEGKTVPHFA